MSRTYVNSKSRRVQNSGIQAWSIPDLIKRYVTNMVPNKDGNRGGTAQGGGSSVVVNTICLLLIDMTSNRYKYFRWTPRTARITLTYMVVVPAIVGYVAYKSDVSLSNIK